MADALRRGLALDLIAGAVRHPDAAARRKLAEAYWDLQYLYKFGLPKIPELDLVHPPFPEPGPDPSPLDRLQVHESVLFGLATGLLGDPDPQPDLPSITNVFGSRSVKLAGAKRLAKRLAAATKLLDKEIERLEKLQ